jgi:hypothetical protein
MATTKEPAELNMVTMTDGRIVEFAGKRKLLKSSFTDEKGLGVRLDFVNGETRVFYLPEALLHKFAVHGAEQKLGDETAGVADPDDMVMAIDDLIDRLYNNEWSVKREAGAMAGASVLAKALVQVSGKSLDAIRTFLSTMSHAEKVAMRNNPKLAPIVAELEAAKAKNKKPGVAIDTDSLLDALSNGAEVASA